MSHGMHLTFFLIDFYRFLLRENCNCWKFDGFEDNFEELKVI